MLIATEASLSMRVERIVSSEKHTQFSDRIHEKKNHFNMSVKQAIFVFSVSDWN